jgi:GNAT superfamily N-acetyltransferase
MGVFNKEGEMKGMFDLGDITDDKHKIQAEIYELTYEMLFVPKENESEQERERRMAVLEEFKKHYFDFYGEQFKNETGVYFNNLDLREQAAYMSFARSASEHEAESAMSVIKKHGESGLQSFVAHAENEDMGEVLLEISNTAPKHVADTVFREYAGFVDTVNNLENYIQREFSIDNTDQFADNVARSILLQGEEILREAAETQSLEKGKTLNKITRISQSALVFLHGLKQLRETHGRINPEIIENCSLQKLGGDELSQSNLKEMKEIYRANYPTNEYPVEVQQSLQKKLESMAQSEDGEFYVLTYQDQVESFVGFKKFSEDEGGRIIKQAAAFNVRPEFQNHRIGQLMIDNALAQEAESSILVANSRADSGLVGRYIERGFVGTQIAKEKGSELLDIVWDKQVNDNYQLKPVARQEIIRLFEENRDGDSAQVKGNGMIQKVDSLDRLNYGPLATGMVVTRMFEHEGDWIVAYEPAPDKEYPESIK